MGATSEAGSLAGLELSAVSERRLLRTGLWMSGCLVGTSPAQGDRPRLSKLRPSHGLPMWASRPIMTSIHPSVVPCLLAMVQQGCPSPTRRRMGTGVSKRAGGVGQRIGAKKCGRTCGKAPKQVASDYACSVIGMLRPETPQRARDLCVHDEVPAPPEAICYGGNAEIQAEGRVLAEDLVTTRIECRGEAGQFRRLGLSDVRSAASFGAIKTSKARPSASCRVCCAVAGRIRRFPRVGNPPMWP